MKHETGKTKPLEANRVSKKRQLILTVHNFLFVYRFSCDGNRALKHKTTGGEKRAVMGLVHLSKCLFD